MTFVRSALLTGQSIGSGETSTCGFGLALGESFLFCSDEPVSFFPCRFQLICRLRTGSNCPVLLSRLTYVVMWRVRQGVKFNCHGTPLYSLARYTPMCLHSSKTIAGLCYDVNAPKLLTGMCDVSVSSLCIFFSLLNFQSTVCVP